MITFCKYICKKIEDNLSIILLMMPIIGGAGLVTGYSIGIFVHGGFIANIIILLGCFLIAIPITFVIIFLLFVLNYIYKSWWGV